MATTALIVEIVVVGSFSLVWVFLFVFKFFGLDVTRVLIWLSLYKEWSTGVILVLAIVSYHLGWLINQVSYFITSWVFTTIIKSRVFKKDSQNYETIKATVFMKSAPFMLDSIREQYSVIRLARSAFVNCLLICIGLFTLDMWYLGLVALGISIIFFFLAYDMYTRYCTRLHYAYQVINQDSHTKKKGTS